MATGAWVESISTALIRVEPSSIPKQHSLQQIVSFVIVSFLLCH